jgi:hypothetical protein
MRKIEVSAGQYESFKRNVFEQISFEKIKINLSKINFHSFEAVEIDGVFVPFTDYAFNNFLQILGVKKGVLKSFEVFNEDSEFNIKKEIVRSLASKRDTEIILLYSNNEQKFVNCYKNEKKQISDQQFFVVIERLLASGKNNSVYIRNIAFTREGHITATLVDSNLEFQFGKVADEVFVGGTNLTLKEDGLQTAFFVQRLVCSNGSIRKTNLSSDFVRTNEEMSSMISALNSDEYRLKNIEEVESRLLRTFYTKASLNEVLDAETHLKNLLGNTYDVLSEDLPFNNLKLIFGEEILNNKENHKYTYTNMTLWDLTNHITATSSKIEQNRLLIPENTNLKLQVLGGNFMFKEPNLIPSNIKQVFEP